MLSGVEQDRLRAIVRLSESHPDMDRTRELEGLGEDHYEYDLRRRPGYTSRSMCATWTTDSPQTIARHLASERANWEATNVPPVVVLKTLYDGEFILGAAEVRTWKASQGADNDAPFRASRWKGYSKPEQEFLTAELIQIFLERYCMLFFVPIDSSVVLMQIAQLKLEPLGDLRGLDKLCTDIASMWWHLSEADRRTESRFLRVRNCVMASGVGTTKQQKTDQALALWEKVEVRMAYAKQQTPSFTEEQLLKAAVMAMRASYKLGDSLAPMVGSGAAALAPRDVRAGKDTRDTRS